MAFRRLQTLSAPILSAVLLGLATACSPGLFLGDGKDQELADAKSYRKINTACAGMQLSSAELDVPTFRKLVSCLNSQGGLEPVQQLVDRLSDEEVQPLVDTGNRYLLRDRKLLYAFNRTFYALKDQRTIDETLKQLGKILENEEFISAGIAVLKDKYFAGRDGNFLKAIERIATQVTASRVGDSLDIGLTIAGSKAFSSLQKRFKGESPAGRSLLGLTEPVIKYLRETGDPGHVNAGKEIIQAVLSGNLLETLDTVTGTSSDEIRERTARLSSVLKVQLADNGRLMGGVASLFHYLHRRPIRCLGGSREVHDGVMHVIREMSQLDSKEAANYVKRNNVLTLTAMNPLCEYPAELGRYYPIMTELAYTSAMEPAAEVLKALYGVKSVGADGSESRPLIEMVASLLADTGSGGAGSPPEDTSGIRNLIPLLAELHDRGAWDDTLLLAMQVRDEERVKLKDILAFLVTPVSSMDGLSVYDVLADAISSTSPGHLFDLIYSMRRFVEADEPILLPAMTGLRSAYHLNDVHPVVELAHNVMAEATRNKAFFDTLFKISERTEFKDTVKLFSAMSKDGRLKELMGVFVTLFEKIAMEGKFEIHSASEPVFEAKVRHNLSAADLVPYELTHAAPPANDPCGKIDLTLKMSETSNPRFAEQVSNMVACLNNSGKYADVQAAMDFFRGQKTEDGRDFLGLSIDLVSALGLSSTQMGVISEKLMTAIDDGRVFRLMDAFPMLVSKPLPASDQERTDFGPVLEPLLDVVRPIIGGVRPGLRRLQEYGAKLLRREELPSVLKYVDELLDQEALPVAAPEPQDLQLKKLERLVRNKECRSDVAPRAEEIGQDYREAVTSWELVTGRPRRGWETPEFKQNLEPLLEKLSRPHAADSRLRVYDSMLQLMRYFTLSQGQRPNRYQHYRAEELVKWLHERSVDYRPITYYYPGESRPRVRLVNTLDRLELVLINADFNAPVISTNFGLKFLGEIAEAWGDEPYEIWPEEIKAKFPNGEGMKTLQQVVEGINDTQGTFEGLIGFPSLPKCFAQDPEAKDPDGGGPIGWMPGMNKLKPFMFNIHQTLPVLQENVDNRGLRVLRDLFFEVYYSTPAEFQSSTSDENHLNIILKMVRMGIFRQLGRNIRYFDANDAALHDAFSALIAGSVTSDVRTLFETLLVKDSGRNTMWKLVGEIFGALGPAGNSSDDAAHFKQLMFYLTATSGHLGLTDFVVKNMAAIFSQYQDYLSSHTDKLQSLFKSRTMSHLARALYEDQNQELKFRFAVIAQDAMRDPSRGIDLVSILKSVDDDTQAKRSWDRFAGRLDSLVATPEYQALELKPIVRDLVRFFEEQSGDPRTNEAARRLRHYFAERMESKDFDQFLLLAKSHPGDFFRLLSTLGRQIENGDLKELARLARRSLSRPGR